MTTTTPNLSLVLYNGTTDQAEYFSTFRAVIAGTSLTSNFYKIDTAYGVQDARIDALESAKGAVLVPAVFISTNYYEATVTEITSYTTGSLIILQLDTASAGTVTLNINSLGTKSVMKIDSTGTPVNISGGELQVDRYYLFMYDGTRYVWVNSTSADQIFTSGTSGNFLRISSSNVIEDSGSSPSTFAVAAKGVTNGDSHDHVGGDGGSIVEGALSLSDITTSNATSSAHGFLPKLSGNTYDVFRGDGTYGLVGNGEGIITDGYLSVSVASNNITLSLLYKDGSTPSSTKPVKARINNIDRNITSALSVTVNAGTNTFNSGSAELATKTVGYFSYLGYNSTDGLVIGFSRIPYARSYGDFNATATNERYGKISTITNAVSTDQYRNVGYFHAILSASASYNWSLPATSVMITQPTFESDWLEWSPVHSRGGTNYTNLPTVNYAYYKVKLGEISFIERHTQNATPGGTGVPKFTSPISANGILQGGFCWNLNSVVSFISYITNSIFDTYKGTDGSVDVTGGNSYEAQFSYRY